MKALINANIFDFEIYKEGQYVLFEEEIKEVGNMSEFKGADEVYDCSGSIIMPSLLNGHTHVYSTFARGLNIPFNPKNFKDILEQLWWKMDSKLDRRAVYYSGIAYAHDCIKSGVTTIIDHHASGLEISGTLNELKKSICDYMSLRGIFCFETSDRFNVDECIKENLDFAKGSKSNNYSGIFGMHASMSLSDNTLKKISDSIDDLPIHIHAAESFEDEEDSKIKYGKSVVKRLDDFNLIKENSILAHCIYLDKEEAEIIGKRNAYAAINPTSNMNNAVGLFDYRLLKEHNVRCILGNDGLGTNISRDYLNLFFGMKYRFKSPIAFSFDDLKEVIDNGYKYAGKLLNIKIGRIKTGYRADMISVLYKSPTAISNDNKMSHLIFGIFDNFHPKDVWCDGEILLKNYEMTKNIGDIYNEIKKESIKVWERIGKGE
ncbi:chlorohydrolase [Clostridium polyendosporum]|uniref:Chlorohydrolase n=1 Tax=Clostridium polyendosporum TaxID=69208 RepID=A0A919S0X8_9CLOT|nr:amidohydrolase family protein [Clostridium polyendosporum]GIM29261.1 chlorohydrolase [Clostridium polyendosporum]